MTDQIVGEVRLHAGSAAPAGWADCSGQLLSIADNLALFSVIGATYGGDGVSAFALPDLRGRVAVHAGYRPGLTARHLGERGGDATATLDESQLPAHTHTFAIPNVGGDSDSTAAITALAFGAPDGSASLAPDSLGAAGGNRPHNNLQPYIALRYIIALAGIVPEPA